MSLVELPLPHLSRFAQRVNDSDAGEIHRDWIGNDEKGNRSHYDRNVSLNESPLRMRLSWKGSSDAPVRFIGVFDLDLHKLLAANYIRISSEGPDKVWLRFHHGLDDVIYIQVNNEGPGLPIGTVS
jgi:hypothetical protein